MTTPVVALTMELQAVAPAVGVSIGSPGDKATWRIDFDAAATRAQKTAAREVLAAFNYAAAEAAHNAIIKLLGELRNAASSDPIYNNLKSGSDAAVRTFVNTTFPAMTPAQQNIITYLLRSVTISSSGLKP